MLLRVFLDIGFDEVYEVAAAAELVSAYTRKYLKIEGVKKPAISSACPVVTRLIGLRFPSLKDNIIQMRFDPTNNNGIYEIASISFMKNKAPEAEKWYDMYLDYASDR